MKKQILFLILLAAAVLVGSGKSYAQIVPTATLNTEEDALTATPTYCVPAIPLTCVENATALTPIAGESYNYEISTSPNAKVTWIVTSDANVLTSQGVLTSAVDADGGGGSYILDAEDGVYANSGNTATDIDITWKTFTQTGVLLVAYAVDEVGCTDNIEVWQILPSYAFTLDIAGLTDAGAQGASECVVPVQTATFNGTSLVKDYGTNYIFFSVNAANWVNSWKPTIAASTNGGSAIGTIEWAYADEASGASSIWHTATDPILASHYSTTSVGSTGQCIVVRVPVQHLAATESLADEVVTLEIDGNMYDSENSDYLSYPDLDEEASSGSGCQTDITDAANYTITPRPNVLEVNPVPGTFVPSNP